MSSLAYNSSSNYGDHSESTSSQSQPRQKEEQDVTSKNVVTVKEEKESVKEHPYEDMDDQENQEKYKKYEADYTRYLTAKYFSDKTIFGGNIYDVKVTTDGQTVKASRLPPYQSYADPAGFHDLLNRVSKSEEETPPETSNGKQATKKSTDA